MLYIEKTQKPLRPRLHGATRFAGGAASHMVDPAWRKTRQGVSQLTQKINSAADKVWDDFVKQPARATAAFVNRLRLALVP